MLLNTFPFLVFFLPVFLAYWSVSAKYRWIVLFLSGCYFYGTHEPAYLLLLLATVAVNYASALKIRSSRKYAKPILLATLAINLGILFVFKYLDFFSFALADTVRLLHWTVRLPKFGLLVPLGISFYAFQSVAYLVDVYRKDRVPEKHFGYFFVFLCFFPQLGAGPISRASELLPQIRKPRMFSYGLAVSGAKLFAFGLFKKLVIADNLAPVVDRVFSGLPQHRGFNLVFAVVLFSWQLYADFSGYTDMARGSARMLGIELPQNFRQPYLATSVGDFWRRWHMSLSRWFRDYVYIPLGGNRNGLVRTCINTVIVFALCGLWHGASVNFLLWGAFHGLVLSAERLAARYAPRPLKIPPVLAVAYTYTTVCVSWVLFRTNTPGEALYVMGNALVGVKNFLSPAYVWASMNQVFVMNRLELGITSILLACAAGLEILSSRTSPALMVSKLPTAVRYAVYTLLVFAILQLRNAEIKPFIYVRF